MTPTHRDKFAATRGEPTDFAPAPKEVIDRLSGIAPPSMRAYWERFGFSTFRDGWFQIVNPEIYAPVIAAWIDGTDLQGRDDYIAVTRSAFGEIRVWGKRTGYDFTLTATSGVMDYCRRNNEKEIANGEADRWGQSIFLDGTRWPATPEEEQEDHYARLFLAVRDRLGPLRNDQMYGFAPPMFLGGQMRAEDAQIVSAPEHLMMLAGLAPRSVLSFDDMVKRAFGEGAAESAGAMLDGGRKPGS